MTVSEKSKFASLLLLLSAVVIPPTAIAGDTDDLTAMLHEFLAGCGVAYDEDS